MDLSFLQIRSCFFPRIKNRSCFKCPCITLCYLNLKCPCITHCYLNYVVEHPLTFFPTGHPLSINCLTEMQSSPSQYKYQQEKEKGKTGRRVGALPENPLRMLDSNLLRGENLTTHLQKIIVSNQKTNDNQQVYQHYGPGDPNKIKDNQPIITRENLLSAQAIITPYKLRDQQRNITLQWPAPCPEQLSRISSGAREL